MRAGAGECVLLAWLVAGCGKSQPTEAARTCRRYATSLSIGSTRYDCSFGSTTYSCRAYHTSRGWSYRGAADFVLEAQVPNRLLSLSEGGNWLGTWAYMGSGGDSTDYRYDGAGRLVGRKRRSYYTDGSGRTQETVLDTVDYRTWDARGRPTSGTISANGETEPVVLTYDDVGRQMEASNGESVTRDSDGNVVREVVVVGFGVPGRIDYTAHATAEVCVDL